MVDISAIVGLSQSVNAIREIAKAMLGLRDAEMLRNKAIEMQEIALQAHERALDARAAQADLLEEKRRLEAKIAEFEDWNLEKQRYELKEVSAGAFAYATKEAMRGAEPAHWLCAACYQDRKKAILQVTGYAGAMGQIEVWGCPRCKSAIKVAARVK